MCEFVRVYIMETQTQGTVALSNITIEIKSPPPGLGISPPAAKEPHCDPRQGVSLPSRESSKGGAMKLHPFKINTSSLLCVFYLMLCQLII